MSIPSSRQFSGGPTGSAASKSEGARERWNALARACFDDLRDPDLVHTKSEWVAKLLPAEGVVDSGGIWGCNGYYSIFSAIEGAARVTLLDSLITGKFREMNKLHPGVTLVETDFYQAACSGELKQIAKEHPAEAWICYDVLLHQPEPIHFILRFFEAFNLRRAVFANPVEADSAGRHDLTFVPGSGRFATNRWDIKESSAVGDHSGWVWLFSHGYLLSLMRYLGLTVREERIIPGVSPEIKIDYSLIHVEKTR